MHRGSSGAWDEVPEDVYDIGVVQLLIPRRTKTTALYQAGSCSAIKVSRSIFVDNQSCLLT